jgi:hypothetical protein
MAEYADPEDWPSEGVEVSLDQLDDYIELLYDSMSDKLRGTFMILGLARHPEALEHLVSNGM